MKNFNKKLLILPVILGVIAFFTAPMISSEMTGAGTFFVVVVAIGVGIMVNRVAAMVKESAGNKK